MEMNHMGEGRISPAVRLRVVATVALIVSLASCLCVAGVAAGRAVTTYRLPGPPVTLGRAYALIDAGWVLASVAVTEDPDCNPIPVPVHSCPIVLAGAGPRFLSLWLAVARPTRENAWQLLRLPWP